MSSDPNAPIAPPMMSPDGKWVWDGRQWIPVADPSAPAHQSVFPAFDAATQNVPVVTLPPAAVEVQIPYSVRPTPVAAPPVGPLWARSQTGLNKYLYVIAGGLVAVIALVLVLQFSGDISLPGSSPPAVTPSATTPASGLVARSDAARADRYMNGILFPALNSLNDTLRPVAKGCGTVLTTVCGAAIPPADRDLKKAIAVFDSSTSMVPSCISAGVAGMRRDLNAMDADLLAAQTAFDNNYSAVVKADLNNYRAALQALANDEHLTTQVLMPVCETGISGP